MDAQPRSLEPINLRPGAGRLTIDTMQEFNTFTFRMCSTYLLLVIAYFFEAGKCFTFALGPPAAPGRARQVTSLRLTQTSVMTKRSEPPGVSPLMTSTKSVGAHAEITSPRPWMKFPSSAGGRHWQCIWGGEHQMLGFDSCSTRGRPDAHLFSDTRSASIALPLGVEQPSLVFVSTAPMLRIKQGHVLKLSQKLRVLFDPPSRSFLGLDQCWLRL